jgi:hypothetical protein
MSLSYSNGLPLDHWPALLYVATLITIIQSSVFAILDFYIGISFRESWLAASVFRTLTA